MALELTAVSDSPGTILVLFDIDGTLIHTAGAGVRGMSRAFERLHNRRDALDAVAIAGRTNRAILTDAFARQAIAVTDDAMEALRDVYLRELPLALAGPVRNGFGVLPGVHATLEALETDAQFTVALLTGNFVRGAEIKLAHFDLWRRFAFGAYGDAHVDRRDLVPVAVERAVSAGRPPRAVVVIGDTPLDIDCAHAHGARAVAVATGSALGSGPDGRRCGLGTGDAGRSGARGRAPAGAVRPVAMSAVGRAIAVSRWVAVFRKPDLCERRESSPSPLTRGKRRAGGRRNTATPIWKPLW